MIPIDAALEAVLGRLPPAVPERVPVGAAGMRFLAADVTADRDLPPADKSKMDGYAVVAGDLDAPPVELACVGEVAAGSDARPLVEPGTCARIFTGANMPPGADAVAIVEDTERVGGDRVRFRAAVERGAHVRPRGEDAREGDVLVARGTWLGAPQVSTCAAVGADPLPVYRVPRVAVLSTGAELRSPSEPVADHEIRNSNGPALSAALARLGVRDVVDMGGVYDDMETIRDRIGEGLEACDAMIVSGGVSKGDYDFVPDAVRAAGLEVHLHGVRMRPGKPFLYATGGGRPLFALPGNPLSVLSSFWEMVAPALLAMMGDPSPGVFRIPARLTEEVAAGGDRTFLMPVHLFSDAGSGGFLARPARDRSSADLAAAGRANGSVRLEPEHGVYPAHTVVEAHPWAIRF